MANRSISSKSSPRNFRRGSGVNNSAMDRYKEKEQVEYTAEQIQQKIATTIRQANEEIKEIQISMSAGFLNDSLKQKLMSQMTQNQGYLRKLERLGKNPFLQNDFIYNRMVRSTLNFYERKLLKPPDQMFKDKIDWIETQFFGWLAQLIKWLQKFDSKNLVLMKQELANVFNWFQTFDKYLEGMKLLQYPTSYKLKKKSSEVKEIDRMTTLAISQQKQQQGTNEDISKIDAFSVANREGANSTTDYGNISPKKISSKQQVKDTQESKPFDFKPADEELKLQETIPQSDRDAIMDNNKISQELQFDKKVQSHGHFTELDLFKSNNGNNRMLPKFKDLPTKKKISSASVSKLQLGLNHRRAESEVEVKRQKDDPPESQSQVKVEDEQISKELMSFEVIGSKESFQKDLRVQSTPKSSISSLSQKDIQANKIYELKRKYLIEAPITFKMNPPPKIVDLTSDFFEKDTDKDQTAPKARNIINNPRQNAHMIDVGKKKITQLRQFHGKMISEALMRDFEVMFAPNEEQPDADFLMDKGLSQGQQFLNQLNQGMMPPALVHDDVLISLQRQNQEKFEFKAAGISLIKRTAQDDYRFQQLEEIQNLKKTLIQGGLNFNFGTLQRAILMPEDVVLDQSDRSYPSPAFGLMKNPFYKSKRAKKKKKAKKRINLNRTANDIDF